MLTKNLFPVIFGNKCNVTTSAPHSQLLKKKQYNFIYKYLLSVLNISSRSPNVIDMPIKKQFVCSNMAFLVPAVSKMNTLFVEIWPASQNVHVSPTFYQFYLENYFPPCSLLKKNIYF